MPALTIDQLIFKGTHNSYQCGGREPPWMNHPPQKQIDDFGVWALELDYSLELERGGPVAYVAHGWPHEHACWGDRLSDYIELILGARALAYRPVFVCLDVKSWKRRWSRFWRRPVDRAFGWQEKWEAGLETFRAVCGERLVVLEDWLREREGRWPLPYELACKIVLYEPNKTDEQGRLLGMRGTHANRCVTPDMVEAAIETGVPIDRIGVRCRGGARVLRLDQYQADWTFDYGVPPNPIVVDPGAAESTVVDDAEGGRWRCGEERSHGQRVGRHGTYRFPYRSIDEAVERARGVTPVTRGIADERRAGYGWTLLVEESLPAPDFGAGFPLRVQTFRRAEG